MKDLDDIKPRIEAQQEAQQKQEYKQVGTVYMKSGCKLYAFDKEENEMAEVKIPASGGIVNWDGTPHTHRKMQYNPNALYFQAINLTNAWRKLKQYNAGRYDLAETFQERTFEKLPTLY